MEGDSHIRVLSNITEKRGVQVDCSDVTTPPSAPFKPVVRILEPEIDALDKQVIYRVSSVHENRKVNTVLYYLESEREQAVHLVNTCVRHKEKDGN